MQRRTVLASMSAVVVGCAGCLGRTTADGSNNSSNGGTTSERPIADEPCPSFTDTVDRTICYHTRDREEETVYVEPSDTVGTVESLEFTLHNQAEHTVGLNPYAWTIYRQGTTDWKHVAPDAVPEPYLMLSPGETIRWSLTPDSSSTPGKTDTDREGNDTVHDGPAKTGQPMTAQETQPRTITIDLETGTYAFQISGNLGSDSDAERIECIALFRIET